MSMMQDWPCGTPTQYFNVLGFTILIRHDLARVTTLIMLHKLTYLFQIQVNLKKQWQIFASQSLSDRVQIYLLNWCFFSVSKLHRCCFSETWTHLQNKTGKGYWTMSYIKMLVYVFQNCKNCSTCKNVKTCT